MSATSEKSVPQTSSARSAPTPAENRIYIDPCKALEAALKLTPAARVDHTYLPNDFTLYLYKTPAWSGETPCPSSWFLKPLMKSSLGKPPEGWVWSPTRSRTVWSYWLCVSRRTVNGFRTRRSPPLDQELLDPIGDVELGQPLPLERVATIAELVDDPDQPFERSDAAS